MPNSMTAFSMALAMKLRLVKLSVVPLMLACVASLSDSKMLLKSVERRGIDLAAVQVEPVAEQQPASAISVPSAPRKRSFLLQQQQGRSDVNVNGGLGPKDAGWFGSFDQMESTYDENGADADLADNAARRVEFGYDPGFNPGASGSGLALHPSVWFDESPSAGKVDAWQTHPSVAAGIAGNTGIRNNQWRDTPEGWVQNYNPSNLVGEKSSGIGRQPADWFDSNVLNYDGFGRENLPYPDSPQRLLDVVGASWVAQAVNTTVGCAQIGCTATAALQAFNPVEQEATNCRLSIGVHATDYDNEWSREAIEFWKVNGLLARAACDPRARGCNASAARPLYSCLQGLPVDHIIDGNGTILIQGRINKMVDECPYQGNLLSGVAVVSCMVRSKAAVAAAQFAANSAAEAADKVTATAVAAEAAKVGATGSKSGILGDTNGDGILDFNETTAMAMNKSMYANARLRCNTPGCATVGIINMDPQYAMLGGKCYMNVTVNQTDFDDGLGAAEEFEFFNVTGIGSLVTHQSPGKNPCNLRYAGTLVSQEDLTYSLVQNYDVTAQLLAVPAGSLNVAAKISENVDECASEGNLLAALVEVRCDPPAVQ